MDFALVYCFSLLGVVTPLQRPGVNTEKTTMGRNKQVSCKICFRVMKSDHVSRHMKQHVKKMKLILQQKENVMR